MKKCIIFGCGNIGKASYKKLKDYYEIVAWSDNDQSLYGQEIDDISIIRPSDIPLLSQKYDLDVFVSMFQTREVVNQLRGLKLSNIYIWKGGFFFSADGLYPLEFPPLKYYKKGSNKSLHVLFVSDAASIRDHKMASIAKKAGAKVFLAYIVKSPYDEWPEYADMYEEIYPVMSIQSLFEFVENSEFDIIHCSNEPDYITPVLIQSEKTVIHYCNNLRSSNESLSPDRLTLEYLTHTGAAGVIYPTTRLRDEAVRKYALQEKRTLVLATEEKDFTFDSKIEDLLRFYETVKVYTQKGV